MTQSKTLNALDNIHFYIRHAKQKLKKGIYSYYWTIGNIYSNGENLKRNPKKALSYYEKFFKVHQKQRSWVDEVELYIEMGNLYREIGNIDKSKEAFVSAGLEIIRRFPQDEKEQIRQQKRYKLDKLLLI